jgi:hypothetical protein
LSFLFVVLFVLNWGFANGFKAKPSASFASLFQKRPLIQCAERWSPRARGEISFCALSFLPSFFLCAYFAKEKSG